MCYKLVELYSACRCLYYEHATDRCADYRRPGHRVQQRVILVGYACSAHQGVRYETSGATSFSWGTKSDATTSNGASRASGGSDEVADRSEDSCSPPCSEKGSSDFEEVSESDDLEDSVDGFPTDHPYCAYKEDILLQVLSIFRDCQGGSQSGQTPSVPADSGASPSSSGGSSSVPVRKRRHSGHGSKEGSEEELQLGRKKRRNAPVKGLLFACTFFKKDPVKYRPCERSAHKRIRDVKQHLRREHFNPFYCSRCWEIFGSEVQRDRHIRIHDCSLRPAEPRERLSVTQTMALNKKVDPKQTPSMQWFSVWDICFPDLLHPDSPYIDPQLSEQLSSFHNYYTERGPDIITGALAERGLITWQGQDMESFRRTVLREALDSIYESWWSTRQSSQSNAATSTTAASASSSGSDGQGTLLNDNTVFIDQGLTGGSEQVIGSASSEPHVGLTPQLLGTTLDPALDFDPSFGMQEFGLESLETLDSLSFSLDGRVDGDDFEFHSFQEDGVD